MNAARSAWPRRLALLVLLSALGVAGLWLAKPLLRPVYYRWRTDLRAVEVGSRTFSYRDMGVGSPVAVIINGVDCQMDGYLDLQRGIAKVTRTIAFDRPGLGESTGTSDPPTLDYMERDMKLLLKALDAPPPYVLIGHSMGGHVIRYYADKHPGEVAGLVFLDQPHEDWFRYIRKTWTKQENDDYFVWWGIKEENGKRLERAKYETNCDMVRGMKIDPSISVLMFTGSNDGHYRKQSPGREADRRAWADMQAELVRGLPDAKHIIDFEVGHFMHVDKPQEVLDEITQLVQRVREKRVSPR